MLFGRQVSVATVPNTPWTASNATFPLAANGVVHGLDRVVSLSWDLGNGDTREVANPNGTLP